MQQPQILLILQGRQLSKGLVQDYLLYQDDHSPLVVNERLNH